MTRPSLESSFHRSIDSVTHLRYIRRSFTEVRRRLIHALESGDFVHEARDARAEKNLLAVGDVTAGDVIRLLQRTRGDQYTVSPHDWDSAIAVHVFKPTVLHVGWYVKAYFLPQGGETAVFISVHPQGGNP